MAAVAAAAATAAYAQIRISAQPLVSGDVLEPSVQNEVDHALSRVPAPPPDMEMRGDATNGLDRFRRELVGTNHLDATELAIRLVSIQRSDGRWLVGTNDVTALAVRILREIPREGCTPGR